MYGSLELIVCYMSILFTAKAAERNLSISWIVRKINTCCSFLCSTFVHEIMFQNKVKPKKNSAELGQEGIFILSCYSCSIVKVKKRSMCICIHMFGVFRTGSEVKFVCKKTQMKKSAHKSTSKKKIENVMRLPRKKKVLRSGKKKIKWHTLGKTVEQKQPHKH